MIQAPSLALCVAIAAGAWELLVSQGADAIDQDAKRDETQYLDSLFHVQDGYSLAPLVRGQPTVEDGRVAFNSDLGTDVAAAQARLKAFAPSLGVPPSETDKVSAQIVNHLEKGPPAAITMDFLSAATKVPRTHSVMP
jgi:hypothetical protein